MPSKGFISESEKRLIDTMNVEEFREYCRYKKTSVHHISVQNITEIWQKERLSILLQRQTDKTK